MYRKHLKEQQEMESKTGIKTIDRIAEIPVVNSALSNVTDYYGKVKEKNVLLRTSFNLAELSVKTMAFAAQPITSICKKPIESVDSYLCNKLHDLEHSYPTIVKPTEQVKATAYSQAKLIYNKTVKEPIDALNNIKERTTDLGFRMVDACLENKYTKYLTSPVLDFTEKSLDYWFPAGEGEISSNNKSIELEEGEPRTLRRIYDINSRLYVATFQQLNRLHFQFENTIARLQSLKQLSDAAISNSKDRINKLIVNVKSNSLVSQCAQIINKNNLSLDNLESLTRGYSKAILNDVTGMIEKYMSLVRNFPLVFNSSLIKQTIDNLNNQLSKGAASVYLGAIIDQLKTIHQALLSYTNQMFQVVSENKLMQIIKRIPSEEKLKAKEEQNKKTRSEELIKETTKTLNEKSKNQQIEKNKKNQEIEFENEKNKNHCQINNNNQLISNDKQQDLQSTSINTIPESQDLNKSNLTSTSASNTTVLEKYSTTNTSSTSSSPVSNPISLATPLSSPPPPTPVYSNNQSNTQNSQVLIENLNKAIHDKLNENLNLLEPEEDSIKEKITQKRSEEDEANESFSSSTSSNHTSDEEEDGDEEEEEDENNTSSGDDESSNQNTSQSTNDQSNITISSNE